MAAQGLRISRLFIANASRRTWPDPCPLATHRLSPAILLHAQGGEKPGPDVHRTKWEVEEVSGKAARKPKWLREKWWGREAG